MVQEVNPRDEASAAPPGPDATNGPSQGNAARHKHTSEEWREEFPYPWNEDDVVTRRDTLRFLLAGSGALFAGWRSPAESVLSSHSLYRFGHADALKDHREGKI